MSTLDLTTFRPLEAAPQAQPGPAQQPPAAPAPPADSGGLDLSTFKPAAAAPSEGGGLGGMLNKYIPDTPESFDMAPIMRGGIKSAGRGLATVLDFFAKDHPIDPKAPPEQPTPRQMRTRQHLQDAANWLKQESEPEGFYENVGATGEQMLEFMGPGELLKLARAAPVLEAGAAAADTPGVLKKAQDIYATLKNNKVLAGLVGIGLHASKDAATMYGQTYLHTEDPEQARNSAIFGGVMGGAAGTLDAGVQAVGRRMARKSAGILAEEEAARAAEAAESAKNAQDARNALPKVTTVNIGSRQIPALESQVNEAGRPVRGAKAPLVAARQQEAARAEITDLAQQATRNVLNKVNDTRPVFPSQDNPARLLTTGGAVEPQAPAYAYNTRGVMSPGAPAPQSSKPFTFTLDTTPIAEATAGGEMVQPAGKFEPTASRVPEGKEPGPQNVAQMGSLARTIPERMQQRTQAFTSATGLGAEDVARGGGILKDTDPHKAESWLSQLEDFQQSATHGKLSEAQQAAIEAQRQALQEQLSMYHASPYARRFDPIDSEGVAGQVGNFGHARDQIQAAVKPVYEALDTASGGQFNKWNKAAKQAEKIMSNSTSMDAYDAAASRLSEANRNIDELLTRHAGDVSRGDYVAARTAWKASSRLGELHALTERMMNGITAEETERGFTQVMTGRTKQLQAYLAKGDNLEQIKGLIGQEGIDNLKSYTELLSTAKGARSVTDVGKAVGEELGRVAERSPESLPSELERYFPYAKRVGRAAAIGGFIGSFIPGVGPQKGAMGGAIATDLARHIIRRGITDPKVGRMIDYAARNGINAKVYAPLIARMIAVPLQEQPEQQGTQ